MKAFILAAGEGTRLRPLTKSIPKCLLPIQGIPLLRVWLENCRAGGITDVLVNAHAHAESVRKFATEQNSGVRVHLAQEGQLLGSAGTLRENREFVAGDQSFFVLYGDVLTNVDLRRMLDFHRQKQMAATIGTYQVPDPSRCGIVEVDDKAIVQSFEEKPSRPRSNWAFAGVMIGGQKMLELLPEFRPADIGFHLLPKLAGRMSAYPIAEYLLDIGTMENYQSAQRNWPGLARACSSASQQGT